MAEKSIEYKGHMVMQGTHLYDLLLLRGKDPEIEVKIKAHFGDILNRYKQLSGGPTPTPNP